MHDLRPAQPRNLLMNFFTIIGIVVSIIIGVPVLYALLLIVAAFLKGFLAL